MAISIIGMGKDCTKYTSCGVRRLPIDHGPGSNAIGHASNVDKAADVRARWDRSRMSLSEPQSPVGCDIDLLTTWNLDL